MPFGYELEFFGAPIKEIGQKYNILCAKKSNKSDYLSFQLKSEIDITCYENWRGGELISPIYSNLELCKKELAEKLIILKENRAYLKKNSDGTRFHVHLQRTLFQNDFEAYKYFLKFLLAFQTEIYDFAKGKEENLRDLGVYYAAPLDKKDVNELLKQKDIFKILSTYQFKNDCIDFSRNIDTVELRYFNSSLDTSVLFEYLEFCVRLGNMIQNKTYDSELIDYYYKRYKSTNRSVSKEKVQAMRRLLI